MIGWLLLACATAEPDPCSDRCADINARKLALAESCGVPEAGAPELCDLTRVDRVDCLVTCMEEEGCDAIDGTAVWSRYGDLSVCTAECPGLYDPGE